MSFHKKKRTDSLIILRVQKSSYGSNSRVNHRNTFCKISQFAKRWSTSKTPSSDTYDCTADRRLTKTITWPCGLRDTCTHWQLFVLPKQQWDTTHLPSSRVNVRSRDCRLTVGRSLICPRHDVTAMLTVPVCVGQWSKGGAWDRAIIFLYMVAFKNTLYMKSLSGQHCFFT